MVRSSTSQTTDLTRDALGTCIFGGLDEVGRSAECTVNRPDDRPQIEARDFDFLIIDGGTLGAILARSRRSV